MDTARARPKYLRSFISRSPKMRFTTRQIDAMIAGDLVSFKAYREDTRVLTMLKAGKPIPYATRHMEVAFTLCMSNAPL